MLSLFKFLLVCVASITVAHAEDPLGDKPFVIGGISTLTGEGAAYGINAQRGAELAIAEINERSEHSPEQRISFQIIWEDETSSQAEAAVSAYKKLTAINKVSIIFGPSYQDAAFALDPLAKRDGVLIVSGSTPALDFSNIFSTWIDPRQEARTIAARVFNDHKSVAILSSAQSWDSLVAAEFKAEFLRLGGKVVAFEEPSPATTDVRTEVLKVKNARPEAIFVSSYMLFSRYLPALKNLGVEQTVFGIELDRSVIKASSGAAKGVIFIGPRFTLGDFDKRFRARFGVNPDIPAYQAYDAVMLLAQAVAERGRSVSDIKQWLETFPSYQGLAGPYLRKEGRLQFSSAFYRFVGDDYLLE